MFVSSSAVCTWSAVVHDVVSGSVLVILDYTTNPISLLTRPRCLIPSCLYIVRAFLLHLRMEVSVLYSPTPPVVAHRPYSCI